MFIIFAYFPFHRNSICILFNKLKINIGISETKARRIVLEIRGGSRTAATSKMVHFGRIVNGYQPLTIIAKSSILDVAAVLDAPLKMPLLKSGNSPVYS